MNFALSLISGSALGIFNALGIVLYAKQVGSGKKTPAMVLMAAIFMMKLGINAAALYFIITASWFQVWGLVIGLGIPLASLVIRQSLRLSKPTGQAL